MAFYLTPRPSSLKYGALVDEERGIKFEQIIKTAMGTIEVFLLTWVGREIPVDCLAPNQVIEHGETYYVRRELRLGRTPHADIPDYVFVDAQERRDAELIVIECLLAFGQIQNGLSLPDGYMRVEAHGRLYRRSDFSF